MNELLAAKKVNAFETLIGAYAKAGVALGDVIDGGAGRGNIASKVVGMLPEGAICYAFEPFPGNHRFFEEAAPGVQLVPKALAAEDAKGQFYVPQVVEEDSEWGRKGLTGYSSVGFLSQTSGKSGAYLDVDCVRAETEIPSDRRIGAVKLDLQGGELDALKGMARLLPEICFMWVEYTGQNGLLEYIESNNFMVFDTEYFFDGDVNEKALDDFEVSRPNFVLSTDQPAWFAYKKTPWRDYPKAFKQYQKRFRLVQTDLACINKRYLDEFIEALAQL